MARFRFTALDADGTLVKSELVATDRAACERILAARGLHPTEIEDLTEPEATTKAQELTDSDFVQTAERLGEAAAARIPLTAALGALAEECRSRRLRGTLLRMHDAIEAGMPLDQALEQAAKSTPPHLSSLLRVGLDSGKLDLVLQRYATATSRRGELRNRIFASLAYPLVVASAAVLVNVAILVTVVPKFNRIFEDFGTSLPGMTVALIALSDMLIAYGLVIGAFFLVLAVAVFTALQHPMARSFRANFLIALPGLGNMYLLTCMSQFARMLALLVRCDCPLPRALSLAAATSQNAWLESKCLALIPELERGESLARAARYVRGLPVEMRQLFRWSERKRGFAETLDAAAEMFESRASLESNVIGPLLEPFVIAMTGLTIGFVVICLFLPLIKLLNDLS
ncbi:MAG TPA: type II secretion system F family protein [Planctomycetaceae bacterium]|nr:type II secretion system F family protein [Planctomycetaceae bacterium]